MIGNQNADTSRDKEEAHILKHEISRVANLPFLQNACKQQNQKQYHSGDGAGERQVQVFAN